MLPVLFAAACQPAPLAEAAAAAVTYTPTIATETAPTEATPTVPTATSWKVEKVVQGLEIPWSIVFTSAERLLVSERPGRVREIVGRAAQPRSFVYFTDVVTVEETGLMGMVLDPNYADNKTLYACYTSQDANGMFDRGGAHDRQRRQPDAGRSVVGWYPSGPSTMPAAGWVSARTEGCTLPAATHAYRPRLRT